nr:hypothetical protein [Pedobacter puniceum]
MKANHNKERLGRSPDFVVVNISSSKNESKSQHVDEVKRLKAGCCKYQ